MAFLGSAPEMTLVGQCDKVAKIGQGHDDVPAACTGLPKVGNLKWATPAQGRRIE
jgi:hypothetical protein